MENKEKNSNKKKKRGLIESVKRILKLFLNPRLLLCFGLAWLITNGWAYILLGIGIWLNVAWMTALATTYLAIIWFPMTPEKIITVTLSFMLLQFIFPRDEKTLGALREMKKEFKRGKIDKKKAKKALDQFDEPTQDNISEAT